MPTQDVVALALTSPIDWGRFEGLVYDILVADDLPRLRRLGGRNDKGLDSVDEAFYDGESEIVTGVQVTSQRSQELKVQSTLDKLKKNGIQCKHLVVVFQQPVTSTTRRSILEAGRVAGVTVEVRDAQYLIAQLSKSGSPIFARYFASPQEQLRLLLDRPDPLKLASTGLRHALMASLGTYVLGSHAGFARETLIDNMILAAIATTSKPSTFSEIERRLRDLAPKATIDSNEVTARLKALLAQGSCSLSAGGYVASDAVAASMGRTIQKTGDAYDAITGHVLAYCENIEDLDGASKGYIERNVRRGILMILRATGPLDSSASFARLGANVSSELKDVLTLDLPPHIGRALLVALSSFIQNPSNRDLIAPFTKTYAALVIRNLDPLGRAWERSVLSRSRLALDSDAVLTLLIEELPSHAALKRALNAMATNGVALLIAPHVLAEVVGHVSRPQKTFRRYSTTLLRMPPALVANDVWHAIVQGYYYAVQSGAPQDPNLYWRKYYDPEDSEEYIKYLLKKRISYIIDPLDEFPKDWSVDFEAICGTVMSLRERNRPKASFRDEEAKEGRVRDDVRMAFHLASPTPSREGEAARGYLASADRAFGVMERDEHWKPRPRISIRTSTMPGLAEFVCESPLSDEELINIIFDPMFAAAADAMSDEIYTLASLGINMKELPLDRLEWDLRKKFGNLLHDYKEVEGEPEHHPTPESALQILKVASDSGYVLEPRVAELAKDYRAISQDAAEERKLREEAELKLRQLAEAARGPTKRGRRRMNRILRELGIELKIDENSPLGDSGA